MRVADRQRAAAPAGPRCAGASRPRRKHRRPGRRPRSRPRAAPRAARPSAVRPASDAGSVAASLTTSRSPGAEQRAAGRARARSRSAPDRGSRCEQAAVPRVAGRRGGPHDACPARRARPRPRGARRSGSAPRARIESSDAAPPPPPGRRASLRSASGMASACIAVSISPGSTVRKRTPVPASSAAQIARQVIERRLGHAVGAPAPGRRRPPRPR